MTEDRSDTNGRGAGAFVFLSHNSLDKPAVEELYNHLLDLDVQPWLDKWDLIPGRPKLESIENALRDAEAVMVCIGQHGLSPMQKEQARVALHRALDDPGYPVIPVILPGAPASPEMPDFLRQRVPFDLHEDRLTRETVRPVLKALEGRRPGPPPLRECPYPGLRAFREEDARSFFGREKDVGTLLARLRDETRLRMLTLVAASGAGKSSLLSAGLLPAVRTGQLDGDYRWSVVTLRPGPRPLHELALRLTDLEEGRTPELRKLKEELSAEETTLSDRVDLHLVRSKSATRLLLAVDQLEEVFTQAAAEQARAFIANLLHAATVPGGRVTVLLALRADFLGRLLDHHRDLAEAVKTSQEVVLSMDADQLQAAIERPALRAHRHFEEGLVDTLVREVEGQPGNLPLLQFVLQKMWDETRGNQLTWRVYRDLGGIRHAIAGYADTQLAGLDERQRQILRRLLSRLVLIAEDKLETLRRVNLSSLEPAARQLAEKMVEARLLVTRGKAEERTVEIAHEALVRNWQTLRDWLMEDREFLLWRQRLSPLVRKWKENQRDSSRLLRGFLLKEAKKWRDSHVDWLRGPATTEPQGKTAWVSAEWELIQASSRSARHRRTAAGLALAVGLTFGTLALNKYLENLQHQHVNAARGLAQLSREAAQQRYPQRALLLACEALRFSEKARTFRAPEAEEALRSSLAGCGGTPLLLPPGSDVFGAVLGWKHRWLASQTAEGRLRLTPLGTPADLTRSPDLTAAEAREADVDCDLRSPQVRFSPDGSWIGVRDGTESKSLCLLQLDPAGKASYRIAQEGTRLFDFSPDGSWLATSDRFGSVRLWQPATGAPIPLAGGEQSPDDDVSVEVLAFVSEWLIAVWDNGSARQWNLRDPSREPMTPTKAIVDAARNASPEGRWRIASANDGFELVGRSLTLRGHDTTTDSASQGVAFDPEDNWVITWSGGAARLWDLTAVRPGAGPEPQILSPQSDVARAAFAPPARWRAEAGDGRRPVVARVRQDGTVSELECDSDGPVHTGEIRVKVFNADGSRLFTAGERDDGRLWQIDEGDCSFLGFGPRRTRAAAFGPGGRWLVTGGVRGRAYLWDLGRDDPGRLARPLVPSVGEDPVTSVALSGDGRWLFAGTAKGDARLWQLGGDGEVLYSAAWPRLGAIHRAVFSADDQYLATAEDDVVRLWTILHDAASVENLLATACRAAGRNLTCDEWREAFGPDKPYRKTCDLPGPEDPCIGESLDQVPG